jgi:hypothetical protein
MIAWLPSFMAGTNVLFILLIAGEVDTIDTGFCGWGATLGVPPPTPGIFTPSVAALAWLLATVCEVTGVLEPPPTPGIETPIFAMRAWLLATVCEVTGGMLLNLNYSTISSTTSSASIT